MGCDGGSIPRRDEMVKLKKKAEKVGYIIVCHMALPSATLTSFCTLSIGRPGYGATSSLEVLCTQWWGTETTYCGLRPRQVRRIDSWNSLFQITTCNGCRLYNKEAVLMALLDKSNIPEVARHIRSTKDVTVLQLTVNPSYRHSGKADTYNDTQTAQYACPVAGLEMSGRYRYVCMILCVWSVELPITAQKTIKVLIICPTGLCTSGGVVVWFLKRPWKRFHLTLVIRYDTSYRYCM